MRFERLGLPIIGDDIKSQVGATITHRVLARLFEDAARRHGHSDADVLLHAISDALLGAIAAGDIGRHFPDTDPQYRGIRSTILLKRVAALVQGKGFRIVNVDSTILAQKPRLAEVMPRMVEEIAKVLEIDPDRVNVKATTSEGLGFAGRGEGIAAYAVALVEEDV